KGEAAGCARDRYFSVLERLTHYFQSGSFELRQLIEKKDAIVGKAHFTRSRERSAAEQADVADGVMRRAKRPPRDKRFFAVEKSGNAVDLGGLDRFIKRHRRNNCWDPLRQHRLPRTRRANHENVVPAGDCHFNCAFDVALPFHVCKIDVVTLVGRKKSGEIAARWKKRKFAAEKLECLAQIMHAVDVDLVHHRGFERVCCRHKERLFAAASRFQRTGSTPLTGRTLPSKASSPTKLNFSNAEVLSPSATAIIPSAIGRSKLGPSFLMSAGARLIVVRLRDHL